MAGLKLSIIVPVYNVEPYIRACMESIFKQRLDEDCFEVIIVNDGTQDRSMQVIGDIIEAHPHISGIEQENLSLSVARNNGIAKAQGEYIIMPDSDDLLVPNSLQTLLNIAIKTKADLIVADYIEMDDKGIDMLIEHPVEQHKLQYQEKTGVKLFIEDLNPRQCYVWRTMYRRDFLLKENLKFAPGIHFQDVPFTHECYLKAGKCVKTNQLFNIYRRGREGAATTAITPKKAKDLCIAIAKTWEFNETSRLKTQPEVTIKYKNNIFELFRVLVYSITHEINDSSKREEIIYFLKSVAPDLKFDNGTKQRLVNILYQWYPRLYLNLYAIYFKLTKT